MPSFSIKLIDDIKSQLDVLNDRLKTAKKEAKDLEKELQKAAKAGQALDPAKLNRLGMLTNSVTQGQQQQVALKQALSSAKGRVELGHAITETLNKSKDVAEKIGRIVQSQLVQKAVYGGEFQAADAGQFLERVAARIPGVYGKAAQMVAGGMAAGLQAATDIHEAQRSYGRGEISREELGLIEEDASGGNAGARNLLSKVGLVQDQESRQRELLGEARDFADLTNMGKNRVTELMQREGNSKNNANELYNRIHAAERRMEKQLGRGLTDEERAKAARAGAAEEIQKGALSETDVIRIINAEKVRQAKLPPPPVISMATMRSNEQASIRLAIRRIPAKIKD